MSKSKGSINQVKDNYVPAMLPNPGRGLEAEPGTNDIVNFVTSDYSMNDPSLIEGFYKEEDAKLSGLIAQGDHFSSGKDCFPYIDGQINKLYADLKDEVPQHEHQATRINATRDARKQTLKSRIELLEDKIAEHTATIKPLIGLRSQFTLHLGVNISLGILITIAAMIFDNVVNYNYYQTVLLSNAALLWVTVIGCSFLSDVSMACLGAYISRKNEDFTSKTLYYTICGALLLMFVVSVVASVMVRIGSMPETYGTIDAAGNAVPPDRYTLAQWGITLVTSFITACTGILSFAFSNDKNAHLVSIREHAEHDRANCIKQLEPMKNELLLLERAPDPLNRDVKKRAAAICQIEALRLGLKLHSLKMFSLKVGEASFDEKLSEVADRLIAEASEEVLDALITSPVTDDTGFSVHDLKKAS